MSEGAITGLLEETTAGNYFVSNYPPYSFWNQDQVAEAREALDRPPRPGAQLGGYVHIPFCRKRCHFCYFKVYTGKDSSEIDRYLDAVTHELALYAGKKLIGGRKPKFIYFGGGVRGPARLRTLLDHEVTVLCATPSYAIHLAKGAAAEQIDLSRAKVKTIIVAGEPGGSIPATRSHIERLWGGVRVVDHHGMTEIGPVSYECPHGRGVLHVMEDAYFPEVIDPTTLQPVEPGSSGELVLTNLGRVGSPILRYRTRDLVRIALEPVGECGSQEMELEGGILGRSDDLIVVRGVNLYPSAVEQVVRSSGGVAEFRVEICIERALTQMTLQIEAAAGEDGEGLSRRLEAAMHCAFGLRVPVSCVPPGTLPRFEGKSKRWVHRQEVTS